VTVPLVSLCFDDGFHRSAERIARQFEERNLRACFCVLAAPAAAEDPAFSGVAMADWSFWREAWNIGHEVAPHGWAHERLDRLKTQQAIAGLDRMLDVFASELPGFEARASLFHAAYLAAPSGIRDWARKRMLGVRVADGGEGVNRPAEARASGVVDCVTFGPDFVDARVMAATERFLAAGSGWLVLVLHGLDGEGWGSISGDGLELLLDRIQNAGARIETPNRVLLNIRSDNT